MTCFAVIFFVTLLSVAPAFAASFTVYDPADYIGRTSADGNTITTEFVFPSTPMYYVYANGTPPSDSFSGSFDYQVDADWTSVLIRTFPFGTFRSSGEVAAGPVVELDDFKKNSVLSVEFFTTFRIKYVNRWENAGPDDTGYITSSASFFFYDGSGNFITAITSSPITNTVYMSSTSGSGHALLNGFDVSIPDNAIYMIPAYRSNFVLPTGSAVVTSISNAGNPWFTVRTTSDAVIEQTETMNAIERHLGEIVDQNETIINGTPEKQAEADAIQDQIDKYHSEMDEAMSELDEYEKWDDTTVMDDIQNFLTADGWKQVRELLSPILDWGPTALIMLLALSMINLSIILFGR